VQHLFTPLRAGVEDDAFTEYRLHEGVSRLLVEILVGGAEEELVCLGSGQQDHCAVGKLKGADVTTFLTHPAHERYRVGSQFLEMPVREIPAGHPRRLWQCSRRLLHSVRHVVSCEFAVGSLSSGASG